MNNGYLAAQVTSPGKLELVERELKEPGPEQVRIRVEACGICRTDALTVEGAFPGIAYPRVPGHEVIGRIDAVGSEVANWSVGQRVGVGFMGGPCNVCVSCRRGDFVNCQQQSMSGVSSDGGYAEVMLAQANGLVAIPDALSSIDAAPLLCAGLTTFAALRKSKARAGDRVAIFGIGGLGHLGVQFAKYMGFEVVAIARGSDKQALATQLGAHHYIDSTAVDPAKELQAMGGARLILGTAANSSALSPLIAGLAPHGELIVAGAGGPEPIALNPMLMLFGERTVSGTMTGTISDTEDTVAFTVLQGIRARIETAPLNDAQRAYQRMMNNEPRFRLVLTMG